MSMPKKMWMHRKPTVVTEPSKQIYDRLIGHGLSDGPIPKGYKNVITLCFIELLDEIIGVQSHKACCNRKVVCFTRFCSCSIHIQLSWNNPNDVVPRVNIFVA